MKTKRNEKWVKAKVSALLKQYDVWYFMPAMGTYGRAGIPDYIACINGRLLAIETKDSINTLTPLQILELEKIGKVGGIAVVVRPDRLQALEALIIDMKAQHTPLTSVGEAFQV